MAAPAASATSRCRSRAPAARNVFATGSPKDKSYIERLGATFIDYTIPVADYVGQHSGGRGFDLVYDTVGGAVLDASFNAVARFGHVVSALGWGTHALAPLSFKAATYSGVFTLLPMLTGKGRAHHGEILREATKTDRGRQDHDPDRPSAIYARDDPGCVSGAERQDRGRAGCGGCGVILVALETSS